MGDLTGRKQEFILNTSYRRFQCAEDQEMVCDGTFSLGGPKALIAGLANGFSKHVLTLELDY